MSTPAGRYGISLNICLDFHSGAKMHEHIIYITLLSESNKAMRGYSVFPQKTVVT